MATLTTSPQIVGRNEAGTIRSYLYAWYDSQSGNSCTVHTRLTVVCAGINYTGTNKSYFMQIGGYNSGVQDWKYAPLNANQEYTVSEAAWTYSGGDQISASAGFWSYVYGSADISLGEAVYVPVFNSAPTGLSVSLAETYTNGARFNVSVNSYGEPSGANGRYIEAGICAQNSYGATYRYNIATNTTSSAITVTNSNYQGGSLNIQPNKRYYFGAYANNTAPGMNVSMIGGQFTTKAEGPTVQFVSATSNTANFTYSVPADGGYYNRAIQYTLDGTNWRTATTVIGGSAKTGTFTANGLLSGAAYTIKTRVSTTVGTTAGNDVSFNTLVSEEDNKNVFYGAVNGRTKEVQTMYGSVSGVARPITKLYGSALDYDAFTGTLLHGRPSGASAFDGDQFTAKMKTTSLWQNRNTFYNLEVYSYPDTNPRLYKLELACIGNIVIELVEGEGSSLAAYGITTTSLDPSDPLTNDTVMLHYKRGARLIHQGIGHVDYGLGRVVYYTDPGRTRTGVAQLLSQADVNLLGQGGTSWTVTINGATIANNTIKGVYLTDKATSIPQYFVNYATYLDTIDIASAHLTSIPDSFACWCENFNSVITIPSTVTAIGNNFLRSCAAFNQPITLPSGLTTIGHSFLACAASALGSFNQNIVLPPSLAAIDTSFLYHQRNMTSEVNVGSLAATVASESDYSLSTYSSTDPEYTTGVKIAGANRAAWISRFPNRTSAPYRKLINAGY